MDVADWLQQLPTPDGAQFLTDKSEEAKHLTTIEFQERFDNSNLGMKIKEKQEAPEKKLESHVAAELSKRYGNSSLVSLKLLVGRELLLWWRDKPAIKAKIMQGKSLNVEFNTVLVQNIVSMVLTSFPRLKI